MTYLFKNAKKYGLINNEYFVFTTNSQEAFANFFILNNDGDVQILSAYFYDLNSFKNDIISL